MRLGFVATGQRSSISERRGEPSGNAVVRGNVLATRPLTMEVVGWPCDEGINTLCIDVRLAVTGPLGSPQILRRCFVDQMAGRVGRCG